MKCFQLDECFNDRRLAEGCNSERQCFVRRFPNRLKQEKDHIILPDLLGKDAPLLTTDFTIVDDHLSDIPEVNSGLIVIRSRNSKKPFTSKAASINLARLKQKFLAWSETDWSGIYLEIDEEAVFLSQPKRVPEGRWISFDRTDFGETLTAELNQLKVRADNPALQND
jgi:hypothetical protein